MAACPECGRPTKEEAKKTKFCLAVKVCAVGWALGFVWILLSAYVDNWQFAAPRWWFTAWTAYTGAFFVAPLAHLIVHYWDIKLDLKGFRVDKLDVPQVTFPPHALTAGEGRQDSAGTGHTGRGSEGKRTGEPDTDTGGGSDETR